MSDRANSFKLGLFTLAAVALLLGLLVVLGSGVFEGPVVRAETYMSDSVQGLEAGAPVKFRGVKVGRVSNIEFVSQKYDVDIGPDNMLAGYVLVAMELNSRKGVDSADLKTTILQGLKLGLHARLASSSLMGPAYLELVLLKEDDSPKLLQITWTPDEIVIPAAPSVLSQITSSIEKVARELAELDFKKTVDHLDNLLASADRVVNEVSMGDLQSSATATLNDARSAAARLREILDSPSIPRILDNVEQVTASLNSGDAQTKDLAEFVKDLPTIAAHLKDVSARLDAMLADPKTTQIVENLDKTLASTPAAAEEIRTFVKRLSVLVAESQGNIERSLSILRSVLENVDSITNDAKNNPSRVLFGEPPPRLKPGNTGESGAQK